MKTQCTKRKKKFLNKVALPLAISKRRSLSLILKKKEKSSDFNISSIAGKSAHRFSVIRYTFLTFENIVNS